MIEDLLRDYQIVFDLRPISENTIIDKNEIICVSATGPFKNVIGTLALRPNHIYSFSFQIITALTCKVGVIKKSAIDALQSEGKDLVGAFSDTKDGYAVFSNGQPRKGTKKDAQMPSKPFFRSFTPGDVVSVVFDGVEGRLNFYLNGEMGGYFVDKAFRQEEFYPAVAIQGDNQKLMQVLLNN